MSYIYLRSGKRFDYGNMSADAVDIQDVAWSLANTCRYRGMTPVHYSVAEHSVSCSYLVPPHLALQALLHDAAEAYMADVPGPLKEYLPDFRAMEKAVEAVVLPALGAPAVLHPEVKRIDAAMLNAEQLRFFPETVLDGKWYNGNTPAVVIAGLPAEAARLLFLQRYAELTGVTQ